MTGNLRTSPADPFPCARPPLTVQTPED